METADPEILQIGDRVLAIGNPLDLNFTVTSGILSARYRDIDENLTLSAINSFLQTDAAINEGMSGSALVNQAGKLVGINAAIISPSGTFAGYGFAIPANLVYKAFHDLVIYHHVRHGCLEGSFADMDDTQAKRLGTGGANGVLVNKLLHNGASYNAGLRKDDVIVSIDGRVVNFAAQLREITALHNPGDQVILSIKRLGKILNIPVILTENNDRRDLTRQDRFGNLKPVTH